MSFNREDLKISDQEVLNNGVVGMPDIPGLTTRDMQLKLDALATFLGQDKYNALIAALADPTNGVMTAFEVTTAIAQAQFESGSGDMQRSIYDTQNKASDIFSYADTAADGTYTTIKSEFSGSKYGTVANSDKLGGNAPSYFATASALATAQSTANNAMPRTGGRFSGEAYAQDVNRAGIVLRNAYVVNSSYTGMSTNYILFMR